MFVFSPSSNIFFVFAAYVLVAGTALSEELISEFNITVGTIGKKNGAEVQGVCGVDFIPGTQIGDDVTVKMETKDPRNPSVVLETSTTVIQYSLATQLYKTVFENPITIDHHFFKRRRSQSKAYTVYWGIMKFEWGRFVKPSYAHFITNSNKSVRGMPDHIEKTSILRLKQFMDEQCIPLRVAGLRWDPAGFESNANSEKYKHNK